MFPNIYYNNYAYVMNHYNLCASKKNFFISIILNKQTLYFTKILYKIGAISTYLILKDKNSRKFIRISPTLFKGEPFFKHIKMISKPSRSISLRLKTMRLIKKLSGITVILLSTSQGIITMDKALSLRIGGKILCILS